MKDQAVLVQLGDPIHVVGQVLLEPLIGEDDVSETLCGRYLQLVNLLEGQDCFTTLLREQRGTTSTWWTNE